MSNLESDPDSPKFDVYLMKGLKWIDDHSVDLFLSLVHPHLSIFGEQFPHRVLTNFKASVVKLFASYLK